MKLTLSRTQSAWFLMTVGSFLFCLGLNLFITPLHLYSGGIIGVAQLIRTLLYSMGFHFNGEISGYINMLMNIPLLIIAYKSISKNFFVLTISSILLQTLFFAVIPVPMIPLLEEQLVNIILGGIITGYGVGLVLRGSGCAGGIDILGVYLTKKLQHFSVGKLSLIFNAILYIICLLLFNFEIAVYSVIYLVIFSFVVDRVHYQNIAVTAMIFTRSLEAQQFIMNDLHRGITYWKGLGAYTKEDTYIMVTAISKYEVNEIRNKILEADPKAFIIFTEGNNINGNFEKHL